MATAPPRKQGKPRYLQLADELRLGVTRGDFPHGFPTEQALTERFKVSRFTIREALKTLQAEGLITRRRGSGTTIMPAATRGGALHQPMSNVGELLQYARDTRFEFTFTGMAPVEREVAEAIGIEDRGDWVHIVGLRRDADGVPLAVNQVYIDAALRDAVDRLTPDGGTIFSQLERLGGVKVASVTQDIQARLVDHLIAGQLNIEIGAPVLRIIRCYVDKAGRTFEISVSHHPGDRFAYAMHHEVS